MLDLITLGTFPPSACLKSMLNDTTPPHFTVCSEAVCVCGWIIMAPVGISSFTEVSFKLNPLVNGKHLNQNKLDPSQASSFPV